MMPNTHFFIISRSVLLRMRNVSDKTYRENKNTNFTSNNNRTVYEIMLRTTVVPDRPQMKIWCIYSLCMLDI